MFADLAAHTAVGIVDVGVVAFAIGTELSAGCASGGALSGGAHCAGRAGLARVGCRTATAVGVVGGGVMALTVILDIKTGQPTAILNATRLTDMRTGAAGAVAAKYLAPKKECVLGVIGTGRQAEAQVRATARELTLTSIRVWSRNPAHAEAFATRLNPLNAKSVSLEHACDCDVLVTTTPSRAPLVKSEWIRAGTHINAIGADAPGKEELDPAILHRARVFVDDPAQAFHSGEINVPIGKGLYQPGMIAGTLGEVVIGRQKREHPDEITIFDSTGLAIQDLAIASIAIRQSTGMDLPFL